VAWMTDPDLRDKAAGRLRDLWHRELDRAPHTRAGLPRVPSAALRVLLYGAPLAELAVLEATPGRSRPTHIASLRSLVSKYSSTLALISTGTF
jgi:hypothetical protein